MDIEKLVEQLNDFNENHIAVFCGSGQCACGYLCDKDDCIVVRAATALSTLQAENEKLRAELEQVKIERDAAVSDLEHIMSLGGNMDTCQLCGNAQCHKRGGTKLCLPKWRGQKED